MRVCCNSDFFFWLMKDPCYPLRLKGKWQKHDEHKQAVIRFVCGVVAVDVRCRWRRASRGRTCALLTVGPKIDRLVDFYRFTMGPLH